MKNYKGLGTTLFVIAAITVSFLRATPQYAQTGAAAGDGLWQAEADF